MGPSILPDRGDSQKRQRTSHTSSLLLWWVQSALKNSSGGSALSIFLEPLRDHVCLDHHPEVLSHLCPQSSCTGPQGRSAQRNVRTLSPPRFPGAHREQALKWLLDTSGDSWGRGLGKGHWETAQCTLIKRLLDDWLCAFRQNTVVFLRKRKTMAQRRRKSSEAGARCWRWGQRPNTDHPLRPTGRKAWSWQSQG